MPKHEGKLINAAYAAEQLRLHGELSSRMIVYQAFYLIYLANYFQFEYGMLHTWDIIAEGRGQVAPELAKLMK